MIYPVCTYIDIYIAQSFTPPPPILSITPANQPPALPSSAGKVLPLAPRIPVPAPHVHQDVSGTGSGFVVAHQRVPSVDGRAQR